jgi:ABC-2 type transport system permease protein
VDIKLKNKDNVAIDTLYFNVPHRMDVKIDIQGAELVLNDEALDQRMYRLATPLAPGAELSTEGHRRLAGKGHSERSGVHRPGSRMAASSTTWTSSRHRLRSGRRVARPEKRRKHELPPNDRMPKLTDDPAQRMQNYLWRYSDWVNVRTTIGTAAGPDRGCAGQLEEGMDRRREALVHIRAGPHGAELLLVPERPLRGGTRNMEGSARQRTGRFA